MSKYNFELDLTPGNSLSIIIGMLEPEMKILEFGSAHGRLTKYLNQTMKCTVDIVEIDMESGNEASQYANRALLGSVDGDLNKEEWYELLTGEKYDYIIFADVLEHLYNPGEILEKCKKLLKKDGSIIISIPNVAHASVITQLLQDDFQYTNVGLLDNTHIRFFAYKSLIRMIDELGYETIEEKATFQGIHTLEMKNKFQNMDKKIVNEIKRHGLSEVFQFVFRIKKKDEDYYSKREKLDLEGSKLNYEAICYILQNGDTGFSESKSITKKISPSYNLVEFDLTTFENKIEKLRIDPIDCNGVIEIKKISVSTKDENLNVNYHTNGIELYKNVYLFNTDDPQIYLDYDSSIKAEKVHLEIFCLDFDSNNINNYLKIFEEMNSLIQTKVNTIQEKEAIVEEKEAIIQEKEAIIQTKEELVQEKEEKVREKEDVLKNYKNELENYKLHYHAAINQREELKSEILLRENMYNEIVTSTSWKITKPMRLILDVIKKLLKSNRYTALFYKGLRSIKNNGLKQTIKKIIDFKKNRESYNRAVVKNTLTKEDHKKQESVKFSKNVKFSITVPLYNTPENFLVEMIESVIDQTYSNWELCLADGSDENHTNVGDIVNKYLKKDVRIKYKKLENNGGISENTNECIEMATGDYIALFDHDDLLHPSALFEYMKAICDKNANFIYCDEDKFENMEGPYFDPYFKSDFAIDNLRSNNYICHFTVFNRTLIEKVGLFRKNFDGSQDHDMVLRLTEKAENIIHIPKVLYHWRVSANSVAMDPYAKPYTINAGISAVKEHLSRCNMEAEIESSKVHPNIYRIKYKIIGIPLVSIIIPNKDHIEDLSRAIDSIIKKSTYENYEIIIIENNSIEKSTFEYYDTLNKYYNIKVVNFESDGKFNYSKINNFGAKFAKGEHLLLLNNDIEVISENWIEEMLMYSQREDVGAVGAKLYYPNDTIQHAGVILGISGVAGHSHKIFKKDESGYFGKCIMQQNFSAVTAACLMMKKSIFEEIDGLDEDFAVAFNDVDLCMRIRKKGYLICWTPYAELYHYESISRGYEDTPEKQERFKGEVERFQKRWKKELEAGDPYYNINLTLEREDFSFK